jgi:hypothetical protein
MIFRIAAIVLFILAAVFAFFMDEPDISLRTIVGLLAIGLACFAAEVFDGIIRGRA